MKLSFNRLASIYGVVISLLFAGVALVLASDLIVVSHRQALHQTTAMAETNALVINKLCSIERRRSKIDIDYAEALASADTRLRNDPRFRPLPWEPVTRAWFDTRHLALVRRETQMRDLLSTDCTAQAKLKTDH